MTTKQLTETDEYKALRKGVYHVTFSYDASSCRLYGFQYDADGNLITNYTDANGHAYYVDLVLATSERPGLMSIADKTKLDDYPAYSELDETLSSAVNKATLGGREVTLYAGGKIVNMGSVAGSSVAENWAKQAEVAGSDVRLIFYEDTSKNQSGVILQVKTTTTGAVRQELYLGETRYIRNVFGTNTTTTTADSWKKTGVVSMAFTASSGLLALKNYDGKEITTVTLPAATTSAAGLMSADDKSKLADLETRIAALEARIAALEAAS